MFFNILLICKFDSSLVTILSEFIFECFILLGRSICILELDLDLGFESKWGLSLFLELFLKFLLYLIGVKDGE